MLFSLQFAIYLYSSWAFCHSVLGTSIALGAQLLHSVFVKSQHLEILPFLQTEVLAACTAILASYFLPQQSET